MITVERLASYIGAEPFRPFLIKMASGQTLEIRHPEMISLRRSSATVYFELSDDPELAKEREREVSLLLMESVEPLDVAAATGGK
jgi:hypothetical protein